MIIYSDSSARHSQFWRVLLLDGSSVSEEVPFSLLARNVVLATGTNDIPARLGVTGESLPFVCHSFWELEAAISRGELDQMSDPVLVVGAGLTAADAVLAAHHLNTPVYHAFRRSVTDPSLIFNQLPKLLYPEYHKVRGGRFTCFSTITSTFSAKMVERRVKRHLSKVKNQH